MANDTTQAYVSMKMPQDLKDRLENMRWETRTPSLAELMRGLLQTSVERHEKGHERHAEMAPSGA